MLLPASVQAQTTHRAYDRGALTMAREIARRLDAPLIANDVTRLLIDLNRSPHNPHRFTRALRAQPRAVRDQLDTEIHAPHWQRVFAHVDAAAPLCHLAVHSFTPVRRGQVRRAEVALLYDPNRPAEKKLCVAWQKALQIARPRWTIRRNYPYRGDSDGLTAALRCRWPESHYLGIEIEVNQRLLGAAADGRGLAALLTQTFSTALQTIALCPTPKPNHPPPTSPRR